MNTQICNKRAAQRLALQASILLAATTTAIAVPTVVDPDLNVATAATGLEQPIGVVFLGANDMLVLEKATGKVQRFVNGVLVGTVLDLPVNSASERGLLSMVLHPNFPATPHAYIYWSQSNTGADSTVAANVDLLANRVDRFIWNGLNFTFDTNILSLRAFQADASQPIRANHNGGVVRFGPDGKLYAMIGDNGRRGFLQNNLTGPFPDDPFGGPAPDDAHATGSIFRINADGTTPTDNPFYNRTPYPSMNRIFAYGIRNGFGMAFDPIGGRLWTQENGDDSMDEMNVVDAGFNGGWIQFCGPLKRITDFRAIEIASGSLQQLRWPPANIATNYITGFKRLMNFPGSHYVDPILSWKYAVAPAGINFINSSALGPKNQGDMLIGASRATLLNGYLFKVNINASRKGFDLTDPRLADGVADNPDKFTINESESLLFGSGFGVVPSIETGPDGNVYCASLDQGKVYVIRHN